MSTKKKNSDKDAASADSTFFGEIGNGINNVFKKIGEVLKPLADKLSVFGKKLKKIFGIGLKGVKNGNNFISPKKFLLPKPVLYFISMFMFSFLVIALETIQFHVLLIVTNYLKSTMIISIAMLGIAIGSLLAYYLNKFKVQAVMFVSSILLFFSIILAYYNIINIGALKYPYFLVLPFVFASINISTIFAHGDSTKIYFTNLVASALGVIFPIIFLPTFKSESSMMILMLVPLIFIFIQSFSIANLPLKAGIAITSFIAIISFSGFIAENVSTPDVINGDIYENKIIAEMDEDTEILSMGGYRKNIPLEFFNRIYKLDKENGVYKFAGDQYDQDRVTYFLQLFGFYKRWIIAKIPILEKQTIIKDVTSLDKQFYELELVPLLRRKHNTRFFRNYDMLFLNRVYEKRDDGNYHMIGDDDDKKRARYLLTQLGHMQTIDLYFDVRYHDTLRDDMKIFTSADRLLLSEDSTLGRLEYTGSLVGGLNPDDIKKAYDVFYMYINGVALDTVVPYDGTATDPRVPWLSMPNPNVFIVGLSADGIVKSCKRLSERVGKSDVTVSGIEINPSILRTMKTGDPFALAAVNPYENVNVYSGEGRSWLENTKEQFDSIYLMNIHMEHGPVSTLAPEYFHTVEGTELLLSKLTDDGYVVYEEIIQNIRGEAALFKMINTIKAAMKNMGIKDPSEHIYIFEWGFSRGSDVFRTIMIKRTPFSDGTEMKKEGWKYKERHTLDRFMNAIIKSNTCYNEKILFDPYGTRYSTELEKYILNDISEYKDIPNRISVGDMNDDILSRLSDPQDVKVIYDTFNYNDRYLRFEINFSRLSDDQKYKLFKVLDKAGYPYEFDITPTVDNSPFPYNVHKVKTEVNDMLYTIILLSLILIIPVLLLMLNKAGQYKMNLTVPNLFVAATGFGYMLVEIVLMQVFQRFIGLPTISLIVTLGGLLLFSGIGSFVSRFLKKRTIIFLTALIPLILFIMLKTLDSTFLYFAENSFGSKIFISILLIFPVTFLMGIPFPNAVEKVKKFTSNEYATLMFGVSGAFSTLGATSAILINVTYGYSMSFAVGIGCYLVGLVFFMMIMMKKEKA